MPRRCLYTTDTSKRKEYKLPVGIPLSTGDRHILSIREFSNPHGYPAVFFHGGSGGGCNDKKAGNFDPALYRIILIDQRGAGESTPKGCLEENTTPHLIEDMEAVRQFLKIKKWIIAGASWGTTLALLYAEKYPDNVAALILRGVSLVRQKDFGVYFKEDCVAAIKYASLWQAFKAHTNEMMMKVGISEEQIDPSLNYSQKPHLHSLNGLELILGFHLNRIIIHYHQMTLRYLFWS